MSDRKQFENESQDARRRDEHNVKHPDDKVGQHNHKSKTAEEKKSHTFDDKRK